MKLRELIEEKHYDILKIAQKYGVYNIRIFGSVAAGNERPDSDIDFIVNIEKGRSLLDLGGLLMDLERLLNHKVDVVTEAGIKKRIKNRVLKEAIPL